MILQGVARRQGFDIKMVEYRLQSRWPEVVGEVLAAHTAPSRIRFHKLYVTVENSMWLHQLTFLKSSILEKIHSKVGQGILTDLIFRVGDIPTREKTGVEDNSDQPRISAESMMAATECSRVIENQDLRYTLTRVIAKALSTS
jgi:predicted nucleic acid-binding Zn ribbon protein